MTENLVTGSTVSICLDFTCYLIVHKHYSGTININYKYNFCQRQPFIKLIDGVSSGFGGQPNDTDKLSMHITGTHTLYDLARTCGASSPGDMDGTDEINIKPLDTAEIPGLVSRSMVKFDKYFVNRSNVVKYWFPNTSWPGITSIDPSGLASPAYKQDEQHTNH